MQHHGQVINTHLERLVKGEGQDTFAWSRAVPAEVLRAVKTRTGHVSPGIINLRRQIYAYTQLDNTYAQINTSERTVDVYLLIK